MSTLDDSTCVICYERSQNATLAPCMHRFCDVCVTGTRNRACPLCRKLIQFYRVDGDADPRCALYDVSDGGDDVSDAEVEELHEGQRNMEMMETRRREREQQRRRQRVRSGNKGNSVYAWMCILLCFLVVVVVFVALDNVLGEIGRGMAAGIAGVR